LTLPLKEVAFRESDSRKTSMIKQVMVAMSGGVDSSVAAQLLVQEGKYNLEGAYIRTWQHEENFFGDCPAAQEIEDARGVAEKLGLPFRVVNLVSHYREKVVDFLVSGYESGITPNPDVLCNREVKFGAFLDIALEAGFGAVATGHYCRKLENPDGTCDILEGTDKNKDQSYFLALLRQEQLQHALFPLGEIEKPQVRKIAREAGLAVANKKDSQGICFLGKVNINDFLGARIEDNPGEIINHLGKVVGEHRGLHHYTIGQRKGIGVPSNTENKAYVVVGKDYSANTLQVAFDEPDAPIYSKQAVVGAFSFVNQTVEGRAKLLAKPRYRDKSTPVELLPLDDGRTLIQFLETQRAIAPGQILAIYDGEVLLGGATYLGSH
jgi:tRNA-specific 2-thiouridylase